MANFLSKVALNIKNLGNAKLDFSHPLSTTAGFGDLQPVHCKLVQPNSNGKIEGKALVRFSTMLAPTFGKVKAKEYHHLVPVSDLFECVAPLLAQTQYYNGNAQLTDNRMLPWCTLGILSRMILIGARCELFVHDGLPTGASKNLVIPMNQVTWGTQLNSMKGNTLINFTTSNNEVVFSDSEWFKQDSDNPNVEGTSTNRVSSFDGFHGCWFNLGKLNQNWFSRIQSRFTPAPQLISKPNFWIPIANNDIGEITGRTKERNVPTDGDVTDSYRYDRHLNPETCDYCIDFVYGTQKEFTLCFQLSAFGKRIRKQIIGSGKQINMESYTAHELVTLTAVDKAYFDLFALTQYQNYENSPLRRFTRSVDALVTSSNFNPCVDALAYSEPFVAFIMDLGRMWYTEQQDAIGAMVTSTAVSPQLGLSSQFIDVDGVAHIGNDVVGQLGNGPDSAVGANGHAFINAIKHGQLDAEYLQKLYKWTNIHTVIGQAIEERLRVEGLGKYVRSCKSNFISYHEELMDISDVVATSDTFNESAGTGKMLGSQGGRGIKLYRTKDASWDCDELSVVVGLLTIVPEADFLQSIDPQSYTVKKTDLILPEFDGLGYEAMRKTLLCGAINWASQSPADNAQPEQSAESVVGLLPRGSHLKLAHAINNGDITLRSTMLGYLPFTLDRYMKLRDYNFKLVHNGNYLKYQLFPTMSPEQIPLGGYHYRFLCKYPWLGNFNRIFANEGLGEDYKFWFAYAINAQSTELGFELTYMDSDNFIVHGLISAPTWSPCKPIDESFETFTEGEKPNARITHA